MNGNRTSFTDSKDGGTPSTVAYCYDNADRLTATTVGNAPAGANPVVGVNLGATALVYDSHGNTTRLADQTLTYDGADRHLATTMTDGTTITYVRDVTGRIVARTDDPQGAGAGAAATTIRYTHTSGGLFGTLNSSGVLLERTLSLPGGVSVTFSADVGTTGVWTYPNLHGDNIIQADAYGTRTGTRSSYDPFGQPINPLTGDIGTITADDSIPNTSPGGADFGWVGSNQKLYEHQGTIATIEMGVRQYVPSLGRFLSCDPVEGGVTNSYDYPGDPINLNDLSGQAAKTVGDWNQAPAKAARANSVRTQLDQRPNVTAGPISPGGFIPAPPDCSRGTCRQGDFAITACALVCLILPYAHRADGQDLMGVGVTIGPEFGLTFDAGSSTNSGTGWAGTGGCSVGTPLGGWAAGGSVSIDANLNGLGYPEISSSGSSGVSSGAGGGCSLGVVFMQETLWGPY